MSPEERASCSAERIVRVIFATISSLASACLGYNYHWCQYHNEVEHGHMLLPYLPNLTRWVTAVAPWVFLVPLAVLCAGLLLRRRPLAVLVAVNCGWLFAVIWPPLCLLAWQLPQTLL